MLLKPHLVFAFAFIFPCFLNEKVEKGFLDFLFSPCKCRCGVPNREARFYGGEYLRGYEFPWVVLIQIHGEHPKTVPGTLINNKYVITGASPLVGLTPYLVKVTFATYNKCIPDTSSSNVSIEEIIIHPDFSAENHANDIALLKLSSMVVFERRISPICLSVPGHSYIGQVSTIVGWPKDKDAEHQSCRPKKLGLPVLGGDECLEATPAPDTFTTDKGCIGLIGTPGIICQEDVGTPVMYRSHGGIYELIGILTGQNKCGDKSASFYTKVNKHLSWIVHNTRDACYCVKT